MRKRNLKRLETERKEKKKLEKQAKYLKKKAECESNIYFSFKCLFNINTIQYHLQVVQDLLK